MLNHFSFQGNANQRCIEIPSHSSQKGFSLDSKDIRDSKGNHTLLISPFEAWEHILIKMTNYFLG
jgi:hypothetical protein